MLAISLAAEKIGSIAGFPITNSLLSTWLTMGVITGLCFIATRKMSLVPSNAQSIAELTVGALYDFFHAVTGKFTKQFFPVVASIFFFVIAANWIGLMPGFGTIGFFHTKEVEISEKHTSVEPVAQPDEHAAEVAPAVDEHATAPVAAHTETETEFVPIFRAATADLNMTVGLALIAVFAIQYFGFKIVGPHYSSKFINFKDPIMFYVGILELISDISKIISFAFRLFGNIFAGEVLLAVMAFLMPFIIPLPFLMMELFVGFIQALVFSMLTAVFLNLAVSHGEEH